MAHDQFRDIIPNQHDAGFPPPAAGDSARDAAYRGHRVVDEHHRSVGKVSDVVFDTDGVPKWVVVNPGVFRAEHYLPLEKTYLSLDGDLVVPFDKQMVVKSPRADREHIMSSVDERHLTEYYDLV